MFIVAVNYDQKVIQHIETETHEEKDRERESENFSET